MMAKLIFGAIKFFSKKSAKSFGGAIAMYIACLCFK